MKRQDICIGELFQVQTIMEETDLQEEGNHLIRPKKDVMK